MTSNFQYALVAHGKTPIAEYTILKGNHRAIAIKMLENLDPKTPRAVVEQGSYIFMTLTDSDGMTFLCLSEKSVTQQMRISFLQDMQRKWRSRYGNHGSTFAMDSKNAEFGNVEIAALIRNYNSERNMKIQEIKNNISVAQEQMTQNLTMTFSRGEQLRVMETKAENIRDSAHTFQREANKVKRKFCIQRARWYVLGAILLLLLIFIIVLIACGGFSFKKCKKSKK